MALFLIARLSARLIHPQAGWFAAFACLTMHGFNFQAADARPYALGTVIMAAGLWFLVRWLDGARWRDAASFLVFAALLLPVHPLYWPFYLVFAGYAAARLVTIRVMPSAARTAVGPAFQSSPWDSLLKRPSESICTRAVIGRGW